MTSHVSCRLPKALGEQLDSAAAENNAFRSELVRRAIRYYVRENPDGLDVLDQSQRRRARSRSTNSEENSTTSRPERTTATDQSGTGSPYDPTEELF
ncbi:ribbon-helix-helix domain-containing protein [Halobacteriaceae archaeon GCM10025711]